MPFSRRHRRIKAAAIVRDFKPNRSAHETKRQETVPSACVPNGIAQRLGRDIVHMRRLSGEQSIGRGTIDRRDDLHRRGRM